MFGRRVTNEEFAAAKEALVKGGLFEDRDDERAVITQVGMDAVQLALLVIAEIEPELFVASVLHVVEASANRAETDDEMVDFGDPK